MSYDFGKHKKKTPKTVRSKAKKTEHKPIPQSNIQPDNSASKSVVTPKSSPDPHKFTRENLIRFVTAKGMMKKYEANWFFLPTPALEISNLIDELLTEGVFERIKNGWIVVAEKFSLLTLYYEI